MNAMILAAGRGTRLGALGRITPKVLLDVGGEPVLRRHLDYLGGEGLKRVVVNAHHHSQQLHAFAAAHRPPPELLVVEEPALLGTAGGVHNALPHLGQTFLVLYGDVLIREPIAPLLAAHVARGAVATLCCYTATSTFGKGVIDVDKNDQVLAFTEKDPAAAGPGLINAGLMVLEADFVADLPVCAYADFGHDLLPQAASRGDRIFVHRLPGAVIDVGTPEALEQARDWIQETRPSTRGGG